MNCLQLLFLPLDGSLAPQIIFTWVKLICFTRGRLLLQKSLFSFHDFYLDPTVNLFYYFVPTFGTHLEAPCLGRVA